MGHRAYIIKLNGNNTEALYSHWGANFLKESLQEPLKKEAEYWKKGQFNKKVNAKDYFLKKLNELIKYETEEKNEKWEKVRNLSRFLDLTMIDIEIWVILNNNNNKNNIYVILPFISLELNGAVIFKVSESAYFNYHTTKAYERYNSLILIWEYSNNDITEKQIIKMITSHFWKGALQHHGALTLVWHYIPKITLEQILNNVPFSVNHLVPILMP